MRGDLYPPLPPEEAKARFEELRRVLDATRKPTSIVEPSPRARADK